jgi:hypothetical protein
VASRSRGEGGGSGREGGGRLEAVPGDVRRRADAGTIGVGRAVGDEWRGPEAAPGPSG